MPTLNMEQRSYASGMNAAALPSATIRQDELSLIINGTVRNGYLRNRPGWVWKPLSFIGESAQLIFETGKYQGSSFFRSNKGNVFIYAVDGHLFSLNPQTGFVVKQTIDKPAFSDKSPHVWIQQRNKWIVAQDGVSPPAVSEGDLITQEVTPTGIPIGTLMADGWHRMVVVSPDRRRIYFSDHEMDPNSTPISFTQQTDYYATARYFEFPPSLGKIMGLAFTPFQDSSTGIGPLVVWGEAGTRAYNIAVPREQWVTSDISQTILPSVGASSFFSYADKGSQLVFRDHNGRIRTIKNAQQFEATDADITNDFPIQPLLESEDKVLAQHSRAVSFDNRVLLLTHPRRDYLADNRFNVVHKGIAVIENENLSDKQDVWSFWTGHNICALDVGNVDGEEMCLAFCRDSNGKNRIYSLTKTGNYDYVPALAGSAQKRIQMTFATPNTDFGVSIAAKKYSAGGLRMTAMRGQVDLTARWQKDGMQPAKWFDHSELHAQCMTWGKKPNCMLSFMADGANPRFVFPGLPDGLSNFYKARAIFDIHGPVQVEEMTISATPIAADAKTNASCKAAVVGTPQVRCGINLFAYDAVSAPAVEPTNLKPCP